MPTHCEDYLVNLQYRRKAAKERRIRQYQLKLVHYCRLLIERLFQVSNNRHVIGRVQYENAVLAHNMHK